MRNTSVPFKRAAYRSQTDEAILLLLEISHPDLAEPIRITSDAINTAHDVDFSATFTRPTTAIHPDSGATVAIDAPCYSNGGLYVRRAEGARAAETLSIPAALGAAATVEVTVRYLGEEFLSAGAEPFIMAEGPLIARRR